MSDVPMFRDVPSQWCANLLDQVSALLMFWWMLPRLFKIRASSSVVLFFDGWSRDCLDREHQDSVVLFFWWIAPRPTQSRTSRQCCRVFLMDGPETVSIESIKTAVLTFRFTRWSRVCHDREHQDSVVLFVGLETVSKESIKTVLTYCFSGWPRDCMSRSNAQCCLALLMGLHFHLIFDRQMFNNI